MRTAKRLGGWLLGLALASVLAGPAGAEVRLYLLDRTEPIVTAEVFEEGPWLFYREGGSPYLFTVARDRVERLEIVRDGAVQTLQITAPGQEAFPDARPQVLLAILDAEDKRVEDVMKKLQEEMQNMVAATSALTASEQPQAGGAPGVITQEARAALTLQQERVNRVLQEAAAVSRRIERILERVVKRGVTRPETRYYFYR